MYFDFDRCEFTELDQFTDAPALRDAERAINWAQLHADTRDWQARATAAGVKPGHALVISGHKQIEFVVAMLGCLRMGVTYVPVDSINPPERLKRIIERVAAVKCYNAALDSFEEGAAEPLPLAEPGLAYIMFTSGSTGGWFQNTVLGSSVS